MASLHDTPQEPEGHGAPRTPGRWKTMWASDCARLEEAHHRGDAEVLVYGRKYLVDMKVRLVVYPLPLLSSFNGSPSIVSICLYCAVVESFCPIVSE